MGADAMRTKRCHICGETLPASAEFFYLNAASYDGFQTACVDCEVARGKERRRAAKARKLAADLDLVIMAVEQMDAEDRHTVLTKLKALGGVGEPRRSSRQSRGSVTPGARA